MIAHPLTGELLPDDLTELERAEAIVDRYLRKQSPHYRFRDELRRRVAELRGPSTLPPPRNRTPHQHRVSGCPRCSTAAHAAREVAWAAGIFELRGTAAAGDEPRLRVIGPLEVVERVREALGGWVYIEGGRHSWNAEGAEARDVAARVAPWLSARRVARLRKAGLLP